MSDRCDKVSSSLRGGAAMTFSLMLVFAPHSFAGAPFFGAALAAEPFPKESAKQAAPVAPRLAPKSRSYAVVGLVDLDDDGQSDLETLRQIIATNGGQIDAELGADGTLEGKLRPDTAQILLGCLPDKTTMPPGAASQLELFLRTAREMGIPSIALAEFLASGSPGRGIVKETPAGFRPRRLPRRPF